MDSLLATTPCGDLLPVRRGSLSLIEADAVSMTVVMPFRNSAEALASAGIVLPATGQQIPLEGGVLRWFGKGAFMAIDAPVPPEAEAHAALTDQSDAWARVVLSGAGSEAVLARLCPVDLREKSFAVDQTCRTLIGHMNGSVTRISEHAFELMVFRSMAKTLVHEVEEAMGHVAARSSQAR